MALGRGRGKQGSIIDPNALSNADREAIVKGFLGDKSTWQKAFLNVFKINVTEEAVKHYQKGFTSAAVSDASLKVFESMASKDYQKIIDVVYRGFRGAHTLATTQDFGEAYQAFRSSGREIAPILSTAGTIGGAGKKAVAYARRRQEASRSPQDILESQLGTMLRESTYGQLIGTGAEASPKYAGALSQARRGLTQSFLEMGFRSEDTMGIMGWKKDKKGNLVQGSPVATLTSQEEAGLKGNTETERDLNRAVELKKKIYAKLVADFTKLYTAQGGAHPEAALETMMKQQGLQVDKPDGIMASAKRGLGLVMLNRMYESAVSTVSTNVQQEMQNVVSGSQLQKLTGATGPWSSYLTSVTKNAGDRFGYTQDQALQAASAYATSAGRMDTGTLTRQLNQQEAFSSKYGMDYPTWAAQMGQGASLGFSGMGGRTAGGFQNQLALSYAQSGGLAKMPDYTQGLFDFSRIIQATTASAAAPQVMAGGQYSAMNLYTALNADKNNPALAGSQGAALMGQLNQGIMNATSASGPAKMLWYNALSQQAGRKLTPSELDYVTAHGMTPSTVGGHTYNPLEAFYGTLQGDLKQGMNRYDVYEVGKTMTGMNPLQIEQLLAHMPQQGKGYTRTMNRLTKLLGNTQAQNLDPNALGDILDISKGGNLQGVMKTILSQGILSDSAASALVDKNGTLKRGVGEAQVVAALKGASPTDQAAEERKALTAQTRAIGELVQKMNAQATTYSNVQGLAGGFGGAGLQVAQFALGQGVFKAFEKGGNLFGSRFSKFGEAFGNKFGTVGQAFMSPWGKVFGVAAGAAIGIAIGSALAHWYDSGHSKQINDFASRHKGQLALKHNAVLGDYFLKQGAHDPGNNPLDYAAAAMRGDIIQASTAVGARRQGNYDVVYDSLGNPHYISITSGPAAPRGPSKIKPFNLRNPGTLANLLMLNQNGQYVDALRKYGDLKTDPNAAQLDRQYLINTVGKSIIPTLDAMDKARAAGKGVAVSTTDKDHNIHITFTIAGDSGQAAKFRWVAGPKGSNTSVQQVQITNADGKKHWVTVKTVKGTHH